MPAPPALLLGLVHGQVGRRQEILGPARLLGEEGDAHAGADAVAGALHRELEALDLGRDLLGELHRAPLVDLRHEDPELVAAQAGQGVHAAHHAGDAAGHDVEQEIPGLVSGGVVEVLELIQVHEQDRPGPLVAAGQRQGSFRLLGEALSVEQAREGVVLGEPRQTRLGALAGRDVHAHGEDLGGLGAPAQEAGVDPGHVTAGAVAAQELRLVLVLGGAAVGHRADPVREGRRVVAAGHQFGEARPGLPQGRVAEQRPPELVEHGDPPVPGLGQDQDLGGLQEAGHEVPLRGQGRHLVTQGDAVAPDIPLQGLQPICQRPRRRLQGVGLVSDPCRGIAAPQGVPDPRELPLGEQGQVLGGAPQAAHGRAEESQQEPLSQEQGQGADVEVSAGGGADLGQGVGDVGDRDEVDRLPAPQAFEGNEQDLVGLVKVVHPHASAQGAECRVRLGSPSEDFQGLRGSRQGGHPGAPGGQDPAVCGDVRRGRAGDQNTGFRPRILSKTDHDVSQGGSEHRDPVVAPLLQ